MEIMSLMPTTFEIFGTRLLCVYASKEGSKVIPPITFLSDDGGIFTRWHC